MFKQLSLVVIGGLFLNGCASSPDEIRSAHVSPLKYKDYNCDQISMEMDYVGQKTTTLYQSLDDKASNDTAQMTVGMLLLWPTLFFLEGGDGPEAAEYAQLKGEYEALRTTSVQKECMNQPETLEAYLGENAKEEEKTEETEKPFGAS